MVWDSGLCLMLRPAADVYILVWGRAGWWEGGQAGSNYIGLLSVKALDRRFIVFLTRLSFLPLHHGADNMGTTGIRQASRQANRGNKEGRQAGKE